MVPWAGGGAGVRGRGDRVTVVRGRCVTGEGRGEGSCEGVESGVDLTVGRAVELGVEILRGSSSASSVTAQTHSTIILTLHSAPASCLCTTWHCNNILCIVELLHSVNNKIYYVHVYYNIVSPTS